MAKPLPEQEPTKALAAASPLAAMPKGDIVGRRKVKTLSADDVDGYITRQTPAGHLAKILARSMRSQRHLLFPQIRTLLWRVGVRYAPAKMVAKRAANAAKPGDNYDGVHHLSS